MGNVKGRHGRDAAKRARREAHAVAVAASPAQTGPVVYADDIRTERSMMENGIDTSYVGPTHQAAIPLIDEAREMGRRLECSDGGLLRVCHSRRDARIVLAVARPDPQSDEPLLRALHSEIESRKDPFLRGIMRIMAAETSSSFDTTRNDTLRVHFGIGQMPSNVKKGKHKKTVIFPGTGTQSYVPYELKPGLHEAYESDVEPFLLEVGALVR